MSDGTRTPSGGVEQLESPATPDWVGLTDRVGHLRTEGQALLTLVEHWSASAHGVIYALEAELGSRSLSDEAFTEVGRLLGMDDVQSLAEEIAAACEPNTRPR